MTDSLERLARKFAEMHKQNQNMPATSLRIATVVASDPLKLQWGDNIVITGDSLIVPKLYTSGVKIPNRYMSAGGGMVDEELTWKVNLQSGDKVIVAPDEYLKLWYVVDHI